MAKNCVTIYYDENRICDKMTYMASRIGLIKPIGRIGILDSNDKLVGHFYQIEGPKRVVDFLSKITETRGGDTITVDVNFNE